MNSSSGNHYPIASLYVGDLAPDVTEAVLFEKFSTAGPVLSIRVCRDIITRRSLGYAYVNYQSSVYAERAIDTLNFERLGGRPIRIMWSQRDPSLRRSGVGNIFIKNLERTVDNKVLFDTFSIFGDILSCKVSYDDKGSSKGYGFVHFDSEEAAQKSIEALNGKIINQKKIFVGKFISRRERENKLGTPRRFTNVYVKNLSSEYDTDDKLRDLFEPFGAITSAVVVVGEDASSKGFGFVCFAAPEGAEAAVNALNGKDMGNGKSLYVGRAQKKAEREAELRRKLEMFKLDRINRCQGVNLYVKNLEDVINDERLQKEFSAFGTITSAKVMTDEKGRSKGFGFVCFSTPEEATKAVTEMNNRIILTKPLYVALAQRKEDREAQKMNMRFTNAPNVRLSQAGHGATGTHPHGIGAAQIAFQANPGLAPITANMQGQPVQPQSQYLIPFTPQAHMQRNYYNPGGPAGVQGGNHANQGIRMQRNWNHNPNAMNRAPVSGQYNNPQFRNMAPRANSQHVSARQAAPAAGAVQTGAIPSGPPSRTFVQAGQTMPVVNNGPNIRGARPQVGNVAGVRGPSAKPASVQGQGGQAIPHVPQVINFFFCFIYFYTKLFSFCSRCQWVLCQNHHPKIKHKFWVRF